MIVFLGCAGGVKSERMQGKKVVASYFGLALKGVWPDLALVFKFYRMGIGIRSTQQSKNMSGATVDGFLIVFPGGSGSEKDKSLCSSQNSTFILEKQLELLS